eukprot:7382086-Prymnesium_polylepis.2
MEERRLVLIPTPRQAHREARADASSAEPEATRLSSKGACWLVALSAPAPPAVAASTGNAERHRAACHAPQVSLALRTCT